MLPFHREQEKELLDQLDWAWGVIANASNGDWQKESKTWQLAAAAWRGHYHKLLQKRHIPWVHFTATGWDYSDRPLVLVTSTGN